MPGNSVELARVNTRCSDKNARMPIDKTGNGRHFGCCQTCHVMTTGLEYKTLPFGLETGLVCLPERGPTLLRSLCRKQKYLCLCFAT